jgi:hypothetical protein
MRLPAFKRFGLGDTRGIAPVDDAWRDVRQPEFAFATRENATAGHVTAGPGFRNTHRRKIGICSISGDNSTVAMVCRHSKK